MRRWTPLKESPTPPPRRKISSIIRESPPLTDDIFHIHGSKSSLQKYLNSKLSSSIPKPFQKKGEDKEELNNDKRISNRFCNNTPNRGETAHQTDKYDFINKGLGVALASNHIMMEVGNDLMSDGLPSSSNYGECTAIGNGCVKGHGSTISNGCVDDRKEGEITANAPGVHVRTLPIKSTHSHDVPDDGQDFPDVPSSLHSSSSLPSVSDSSLPPPVEFSDNLLDIQTASSDHLPTVCPVPTYPDSYALAQKPDSVSPWVGPAVGQNSHTEYGESCDPHQGRYNRCVVRGSAEGSCDKYDPPQIQSKPPRDTCKSSQESCRHESRNGDNDSCPLQKDDCVRKHPLGQDLNSSDIIHGSYQEYDRKPDFPPERTTDDQPGVPRRKVSLHYHGFPRHMVDDYNPKRFLQTVHDNIYQPDSKKPDRELHRTNTSQSQKSNFARDTFGIGADGKHHETYAMISCIVTMCFNLPIGLIAFWFSCLANKNFQRGNNKRGDCLANVALFISMFGIVSALLLIITLVYKGADAEE